MTVAVEEKEHTWRKWYDEKFRCIECGIVKTLDVNAPQNPERPSPRDWVYRWDKRHRKDFKRAHEFKGVCPGRDL